jgi:hypothetical protein
MHRVMKYKNDDNLKKKFDRVMLVHVIIIWNQQMITRLQISTGIIF